MLIFIAWGNDVFIIKLSYRKNIIMLNENIRNLRKQKSLSQEELANRIHAVRQTVSKWKVVYLFLIVIHQGIWIPFSNFICWCFGHIL